MIFANFKEVLSHKSTFIPFLVSFSAMGLFFYLMSDFEIIKGNYWAHIMWLDIFLNIFITLFFSVFISLTIFRIKYFWGALWKDWYFWWVWAFFWILITGCPVCSLNLAFYLWLSSIFTSASFSVFGREFNLFPLWWIEIKILWLLIIVYSVIHSLKNLKICKIKKPNS